MAWAGVRFLMRQSRDASEKPTSLPSQACSRYGAAAATAPPPPGALFNWGVALTDLARAGDPSARAVRLKAAASKYGAAVREDAANPRALNNWGLALADLAASAPPAARPVLLAGAAARFRAALWARPDFERASYNLGTVLHAASRAAATDADSASDLAAAAAACVALAAAAAPGVDAYSAALTAVRPALPIPALRAGWLLVADGGPDSDDGGGGGGGEGGSTQPAPPGEWLAARWCVLDADSLRTSPPPSTAPPPPSHWPTPLSPSDAAPHRLPLASVACAAPCDDASLPTGGGVAVTVRATTTTAFYVAPTANSAAAWADALTVGAHVVATRGAGALAAVLSGGEGGAGGGRRST